MTKDKKDIFFQGTDYERNRLIVLIDKLPSIFFADLDGWVDAVKELYDLIVKLEERDGTSD